MSETDTRIFALTEEANDLVDEQFVTQEGYELTSEEVETVREELDFDIDDEAFDVDGLKEKFEAIRGDEKVDFDDVVIDGSRYGEGDASIDAAVASEVHRHLKLTREQAAHDGLWRYLAVVEFPHFVRYRWPYPDSSSNRSLGSARDKYLEDAQDLYEHALVRLWWIAELTHDGDDYGLTRDALERQELANDLFDRGYARYPPAVRATVSELSDASSTVVSNTTTKLNHALSTIRLETLEESDLESMVADIRAQVEASVTE